MILAFTLLFVYDYFPHLPLGETIPKGVPIALFLGFFFFSLIFKKYRDTDNKKVLQWQIYSTTYILLLIGILTLLGGQSSSGIAYDNSFLWVILLFSLLEITSQWKKVKDSEA